jgi:hypothetical protein
MREALDLIPAPKKKRPKKTTTTKKKPLLKSLALQLHTGPTGKCGEPLLFTAGRVANCAILEKSSNMNKIENADYL